MISTLVGSSEPASYTWPITGNPYSNACNAIIAHYSNVNPASPIDGGGCLYTASSATVKAPSITTLTANDRLLWIGTGFKNGFGSSQWSTPAGFTQRSVGGANGNLGSNLADEVFATPGVTGAVSASMTTVDPNIGPFVLLRPHQAAARPRLPLPARPERRPRVQPRPGPRLRLQPQPGRRHL